jgi:hypothetical protein
MWVRIFTMVVVTVAAAVWVFAVAYTLGYSVPGLPPPEKTMRVPP